MPGGTGAPLTVDGGRFPGVQAAQASASATLDKDGWWNVVQGRQPGEPANPVRPAIPKLPTTLPGNVITASLTGGTVDKLAAVGVVLEAPIGAGAALLKLTLKESAERGANVNAAQAKVFACPITTFWGEVKNGSWVDRPAVDCGAGRAEGARNPDGTWTFDLTAIANRWLDRASNLAQNGVRLEVDASTGQAGQFQVSWLDVAAGGVKIDFVPGIAPPQATPEPTPVFEETPASFGPILPPAVATVSPVATPEPLPKVVIAQPARQGGRLALDPNIFGNLPWTAVLLIPLVLGLAFVTGTVLGPAGEPSEAGRRQGAVSRVLARREAEARGGDVPRDDRG